MIFRLAAALAAAAALVAFIAPVALKLGDWALSIVVLAGLALMLADLVQSLRE